MRNIFSCKGNETPRKLSGVCYTEDLQTAVTWYYDSSYRSGLRRISVCLGKQGREIEEPHYNDVIMGTIASQITSLTIVYSIVYSDADQRNHQSSASLAFVRGIHRGPVNSPHKWPVTRNMFPFDASWWCHFMATLLSLLAICEWNQLAIARCYSQRGSNVEFWFC